MATEKLTPGYRYQSLDILRGVASLVVVIYHYRHFFFQPGEIEVDPVHPQFLVENLPFYPLLDVVYFSGWKAVQLFFVLSGFIFFAIYHRKVNDRTVRGKEFTILRFSRLYPLHFLTLVTVAVLQAVSLSQNGDYLFYKYNDLRHFVLNLFMATDWGLKIGDSFNGPVWSVSIEILLYACFFWFSRFVRFTFTRCLIVVALAMGFWMVDYQISNALACFFAGGAMYFVNEKFLEAVRSPRRRSLLSFGILALSLVVLAIVPRQHFLFNRVMYFFVFPSVVLSLATLDRSFSLRLQSIRWIGDITYSTYMLHVPVQISMMLLIGWSGVTFDFYNEWFMVTYVSVVILLSIISYRWFEMPMQSALRKRWLTSGH